MNLFDYAVKVASLLGSKDNRQYAFLLTPRGIVICAGAHTGDAAATYETALVNALQNNYRSIDRESSWAVCTYLPTEMCRGMAHLLGVHGIWFPNRGVPTILRMKGGWNQGEFDSKVPNFTNACNVNPRFAWKADTPGALLQAADPRDFTPAATGLLTQLENAAKNPSATRKQESATLASALRTLPISDPPGGGAFAQADEVYTHLVFGMVGQTWNPTMQAVSNRDPLESGEVLMGNNIAGIMLDEKFKIVAWALNFAAENPTYHAETLMLQRFLRENGLKKLPPNYTVYTSLQPCDMCGSFLLHAGNNTNVVYCLRDVNLRTVLTESRTGTTERQVSIRAATDIAGKLATKNLTAQTHSANLLRDSADADYRGANADFLYNDLWLRRNTLSKEDLDDLFFLQNKKARGQRLKQADFDWMVATQRKYDDIEKTKKWRSNNAKDMQTSSPFHSTPGSVGTLANAPIKGKDDTIIAPAKERLGFEFVKSADLILDWASSKTADAKVVKAAQQGVEVFEALVTAGLATAYGLKMIDLVIQKQERLAALAAKTTATTKT